MFKTKVFFLLWVLFLVGCSNPRPLATITVSETNFLDREMKYVSAVIPCPDLGETPDLLLAEDIETHASVSTENNHFDR